MVKQEILAILNVLKARCKVYVTFCDKQAGVKAVRSSYLGRQNSWIPIEKCEADIPAKKEWASPSIKCIQFPLTLAWTSTVHKVQGFSLEQGVIDFDLLEQKSFWPRQRHTTLIHYNLIW